MAASATEAIEGPKKTFLQKLLDGIEIVGKLPHPAYVIWTAILLVWFALGIPWGLR